MTAAHKLVDPATEPVLVELRARVVLFGPVHEGVVLSLHPYGVSVRRIGLLGVTLGPDHHYFAYKNLRTVDHGDHLFLTDATDETRTLTLSGSGASVLGQLLEILETDGEEQVFAASGHSSTRFGIQMNGVALGGATGLLFVPLGVFGLLTAATVRMSMDDIRWVQADDNGIQVHGAEDGQQAVYLESKRPLAAGFAEWWLARQPLPEPTDAADLTCMWIDQQEGILSHGSLRLIPGGIALQSIEGPARLLRSSGLQLEMSDPTQRAGSTHRVRLRVKGVPHTLWLDAAEEGAARLSAHLSANVGVAWPSDFQASAWKGAAGGWEVIRLLVPGEGEVVVPGIKIDVGERGITLPVDAPIQLGAPPFDVGKRLRVELVNSRGGLSFTAIVAQLRTSGDIPTDAPDRQILLVPTDLKPGRRPPRRSVFRALVSQDLRATVSIGEGDRWTGRLLNLSSEGAGIELDADPTNLEEGSIVTAKLTLSSGERVRVHGEVRHHSALEEGSVALGLRFIGSSERLRTRFQRAALQLEREFQLIEAEALEDTDALPSVPIIREPSFVEMDTVDLTIPEVT